MRKVGEKRAVPVRFRRIRAYFDMFWKRGFTNIPVYIYVARKFVTILMSSQSITRGNTFARQPGSIDVNVQFDYDEMARRRAASYRDSAKKLYRLGTDKQTLNVLEGEVLVTDQTKSGRNRDQRLHVFSSANGLVASGGLTKTSLFDRFTFAGVAVTPVDVAGSNRDQGFVSAFAGLNKIFNTGDGQIHAGDIVLLSAPGWDVKRNGPAGSRMGGTSRTTASNKGLPRDKIRFGVTSMRYSKDDFAKQVASENPQGRAKEVSDAITKREKEKATRLILDQFHSMQRRVIGKALSHAKPGQAFDIVLRGG